MRVFSLPQLTLLTRAQLFALVAMLTEIIANPATTPEDREIATALLQNVRFALSRKHPCP
jgi:hypothetical protein